MRPRRISNRQIPPPPAKTNPAPPPRKSPPHPPNSQLPNRGNKPKKRPNFKSKTPIRKNNNNNHNNNNHNNNHNNHNNMNQMKKTNSYDHASSRIDDLHQPSLFRQQQSAPINEDEFRLNGHLDQVAQFKQYHKFNGSKSEAVIKSGWDMSQSNAQKNQDIVYVNENTVMTQLKNNESVSRIITETKKHNNNNNNIAFQMTSVNNNNNNNDGFNFMGYDDDDDDNDDNDNNNNNNNNHIEAHRRGHRKKKSQQMKKDRKVGFAPDVNVNNAINNRLEYNRLEYGSEYETDDSMTNGDNHINNDNDDEYKTILLPESLRNEQTALQDLHDIILLYQQAIHDVHQAIVDVKETSQDITYKVKSVTEQLHMIIDRREDELLDEITKKTASKIFALDSQFTKLTQNLMFCREARDEAEELLAKHDEYNQNNKNNKNHKPLPKASRNAYPASGIKHNKTRLREHSGGSVTNYNARKDRIMAIVNKAKQDAKNEFEKELNRGTPVVTTRFHVEHYDITEQLETLGTIIEDAPLEQYQLYPPAITKTKAFRKSVRIQIKSREKIDHGTEHQILACQFEPQLVFATAQDLGFDNDNDNDNNINNNNNNNNNNNQTHSRTESRRAYRQKRAQSITSLPEHLSNPEKLNWQSLGWIELNPAPATKQMFGKSKRRVPSDDLPSWNSTAGNYSAPTMSNLQKLKKELDLDHIITQHTKLITGLTDILNEADGKYTYIRVRMRKLVKFEEDVHNTDLAAIKKRKKKTKTKIQTFTKK